MKESLAEALRLLREAKKVSLREVEKHTKISNAYLSQLERGEATKPSPDVLHTVAKYYKVPYETLMIDAGYIESKTTQTKTPNAFAASLMSAGLNKEEKELVLNYIDFLRTQRKKGK